MARLSESATIETGLFEHRLMKDDFINPCCFGEDFAAWLQVRLANLEGVTMEAPCMEDYGWSFLVEHPSGTCQVAVSFAHEGPVGPPANWVVSVDWTERKLLQRWFGKPDETTFRQVADAVRSALENEPAIRVLA